jgi:cell division septation protein DedD
MIGTYIRELLKSHNRVIVPDLGAFLRKNENPDLLYFNEFLRFNDGLLLDYLAEKENIDKIEAAKKIKNYVADINSKLKDKQPVDLKDIGTLYMDNTDKIQLKIDLLKIFVPEEPSNTEKTEVKEAKKVKEVKKEIIPTPTPIIEEKIPEPVIEKQKEEIPLTEEKKTAQEITFGSMDEPSAEQPKKTGPKIEDIVNPPVKNHYGIGLWLTIVIVLIALFLVWFYIIRPKYNKPSNQNNIIKSDTAALISNPVSDSIPKTDTSKKVIDNTAAKKESNLRTSIKKEPDITTSLVKKPNKTTVSLSAKTNKMYYLVVGCFAMESNANKLVQSLKVKGFNAQIIAKIDQMYFVSIASFTDKQSAKSEMAKLKLQGYSCWLKYY